MPPGKLFFAGLRNFVDLPKRQCASAFILLPSFAVSPAKHLAEATVCLQPKKFGIVPVGWKPNSEFCDPASSFPLDGSQSRNSSIAKNSRLQLVVHLSVTAGP